MQPIFKRKLSLFKPLFSRGFFILLGMLVIFGLIFIVRTLSSYQLTPTNLIDILQADVSRIKQHGGRTNIVLLGMGGQSHDSGDLTDTIMVASIGYSQKDVLLISLPRDIWIPTLKDRINAAYRLGEAKMVSGGMTLAKSAVEEVVGLPIHYAVLVDFSGFTQMIDVVGGIDVLVEESFIDPLYPIGGRENDLCEGDPEYHCRYEEISFSKGIEHMDGGRALKYVRSRHAEGDIGNDFSRGQRQQAVLLSLRNKLLSSEILTNLETLRRFIKITGESITSDIPLHQALILGRILKNEFSMRTTVLTQDEPDKQKVGLLVNPPLWQYDGAWVLVPKHEGFTAIGKYIQCVIENTSECSELLK
jgi:LCP family protein required for cell wall assembly